MAVLGSILVDREMMATVAEICAPTTFTRTCTRRFSGALLQLYERGEPLDKITVAEELRRRALLDKVGGIAVPQLADGYGADGRLGRVLRQHRPRESGAARFDPCRHADHAHRFRKSEEDVDGALDRERADRLRSRPPSADRRLQSDLQAAQGDVRADRPSLSQPRRPYRHHFGFPRHRSLHGGLPTRQFHHRRSPAGDGQDVNGPDDGRRRGERSPETNRDLFAGNDERRARLASALCGSAHQRARLAHRATSRTTSGRRSRTA